MKFRIGDFSLVNQVNNNRSDSYLNGLNGYNSLKNAGKLNQDDSSSDSSGSRVDNAKSNVAALKESIQGSRDLMGANRGNDVTHNFDDFETSFL